MFTSSDIFKIVPFSVLYVNINVSMSDTLEITIYNDLDYSVYDAESWDSFL